VPAIDRVTAEYGKYRQASRQIFEIYSHYSELVEPLSLDEAYLDVSQTLLHKGSATLIAQEIRARVAANVGITVSAGVAPNKFLAKIASDWNKPDGLFVILPDQVNDFVSELPVARLFGVGKVTAAKLNGMGIHYCRDLMQYSLPELMRQFGKLGNTLYLLCRGIDQRAVIVSSERKSISVEETYAHDLPDYGACLNELPELYAALQARIERAQCLNLKQKVYVKIRFSDFRQTTVESSGSELSLKVYAQLLQTAYSRFNQPVRLLGLGIRLADPENPLQLSLFS